jgi:acetyl-CoA acetyltransferase
VRAISLRPRLLDRTGLRIDDIDHYEVNEAFASVPLAWMSELKADPSRLNPLGGAFALGHPLVHQALDSSPLSFIR